MVVPGGESLSSTRRAALALAGPPPGLRYRRHLHPFASLGHLWQVREVVRALAEREFRVRYKQAFLGVAWALIAPVALMIIFSLLFSRVARVDTGDVPYAVFAFVGLVPWTFFSVAVLQGGMSLLINAPLIQKVSFPREVFPVASTVVAGIDALVSLVVLVVIMLVTGTVPQPTTVWVPLLLLIQLAFVLGITFVLSVLIVFFRDLRHGLPIILQLGLFATPVAYGIEAVPERFRLLYAALNPLGPVIDGYRRVVLYGQAPDWGPTLVAAISAAVVFFGGYLIFKRLEGPLADAV
jgi:ABC-2 type transport system permease protein/lipopolysaccharide transport system permease protein